MQNLTKSPESASFAEAEEPHVLVLPIGVINAYLTGELVLLASLTAKRTYFEPNSY